MNAIEKLAKLQEKKSLKAIGLMSGTSADGVSAVIVEIKGNWINTKFRIIAHKTYPYTNEVKEKIFELFNPNTSTVEKICIMNFILGKIFAETVIRIVKESGMRMDEIDFIASHGQTIYHNPSKTKIGKYQVKSTLQIGEPSIIAEETGILTIADFRPKDMAVNGEGAPLTAYADYIIFRSKKFSRAIQNIGGIANVTFIPKEASMNNVIAFDTGPGNILIDYIVNRLTNGKLSYDPYGKIASRGEISEELLEWLMQHPYLKRKPPKTTGRRDFGHKFAKKILERAAQLKLRNEDLIATLTKYTAKSIAESYRKYLPEIPDEMIIGGGGSYNKTLINMIREELEGVKIRFHDEFGIPVQAKEPLLMVILANELIHGHFNNIPSATGAKRKVIMGKIVLGRYSD